jgi:uncharacterized protein
MLPQTLGPVEVRVLFSLVEKELSTPDHYPLSLNALTNACNQSSNRDPVMALDEETVAGALTTLRRANLVRQIQSIGSRVPKFEHLLVTAADLSRVELAILCVLALRGHQTLAEVRTRAARLVSAEESDRLEAAAEGLIERAGPPLVARLPRRPGQKEARYAHLLSGDVHQDVDDAPTAPPPAPSSDRIAELERLVQELREEVSDLRAQLDSFRKQFE